MGKPVLHFLSRIIRSLNYSFHSVSGSVPYPAFQAQTFGLVYSFSSKTDSLDESENLKREPKHSKL